MVKKILITSAIIACSLSNAFAGSLYVGPALNYENLRAGSIRYQGIRPILVGGYGDMIREWLYLAGELFIGPKPIDINNEPKNSINLKSSYSYGGSVIPGIYLDEELMAFLRFGLVSTKFDNLNTIKSGTVLGLGLETKVMDCWYLRGEYDYVSYSNISAVGSLRSDQFNVAVIYRF